MRILAPLQPIEPLPGAHAGGGPQRLGLVMGGGGARAAYQVGVLRFIARRFPNLVFPYVTGVSAGAINAALLASHHGTFLQAVRELSHLWGTLTIEDVFRVDTRSLGMHVLQWLLQLSSGGVGGPSTVRGLVDTEPLRDFLREALHVVDDELTGVQYNIDHGRLKALAITATSYSSGRSVTWVQGSDIAPWERPQRVVRMTTICVDHVMASASLPIFFPAVRVGPSWYGDGGIRLVAPLSPAIHLGATKILAISTRYDRGQDEAEPASEGYPPPAQVAGILMNAVFLDLLEQDALRVETVNRLISPLPETDRHGLKRVELLTLRPSQDLGKLAAGFEEGLPRAFRFLTRGLGTRQTRNADALSMVMFLPGYLRTLMDAGEADAETHEHEIAEFLRTPGPTEDVTVGSGGTLPVSGLNLARGRKG